MKARSLPVSRSYPRFLSPRLRKAMAGEALTALSAALFLFLSLSYLPVFAQDKNYPVYTSEAPPPIGVYLSASEYLNLKPQETEIIFQHIAQSEGEGINYFYRKKANGKKGDKISPDSCFAASDGKTFYIAYEGKWNKAKKTDGEYGFVARLSRTTNVSVAYSGSGGAVVLEDPYIMKFSLAEGQWLPMERATNKMK